MENSKLSLLRTPYLGALLGTAFFFFEFGAAICKPAYLDWQIQNDPAQHYLGWEFFRHEAWHLPLGKIAGYGAPEGSSIVFTDSIPLFALFFKFIRGVLPQPFQYTGLWMLFCYMLQGFFGWMLGSLVTRSNWCRAMVSFLFIVSPPMLDRAVGHHSLMGHWVLLAALYLAFQSSATYAMRHSRMSWHTAWGLVMVLSALVHLYLYTMVFLIYAGAMVTFLNRCRWRGQGNYLRAAAPAALGSLALYLEGAFVVRSSDWAGAWGFGYFSMNLLSPLVPGTTGNPTETSFVSYFLTSQKWAVAGQLFEGFNYLGIGVWVLVGLALVAKLLLVLSKFWNRGRIEWRVALRSYVPYPVMAALLLLLLFALSNVIVAGDKTLVTLTLGPKLHHFAEIFRSSGRFFWPVGYAILWWSLKSVCACIRKTEVAVGVLTLVAGVQALDLSQFFLHHAMPFRAEEHYSSPLKSQFWPNAVKHYRHVLYYPPGDVGYYVPLGLVAAPEGTTINVAYKARSNSDSLPRHERELKSQLESGALRSDSLYVFRDATLFEKLGKQVPALGLLKQVDGLYVAGMASVGDGS